MIKRMQKTRMRLGVAITEVAAAMVLIMPLLVVTAFVVVEASQAFTINETLHQCALVAARNLAILYGHNPSLAQSTAGQQQVFQHIKVGNIVNSSQQFSIPNGGWKITSNPPTVTVTCTYQSGQHGCPKFPSPDPLKLGDTFVLQAQASYRLE